VRPAPEFAAKVKKPLTTGAFFAAVASPKNMPHIARWARRDWRESVVV